MKNRPLIDELLDDYLPRRYYGHEARKHAKELALKFFEMARQTYAMEEEVNHELFFKNPMTIAERDTFLSKWGFNSKVKPDLILNNESKD
jgi:hypothetical protein